MQTKNIQDIPNSSVALALAFLNLGPADPAQPFGRLIPGKANRQIADLLEENAERFFAVLTQQAVSDALVDPTRLTDGTPVYQMHRHCEIPVFTFAALQCALERLPTGQWPLVVIGHPRHLRRARMDIQALAGDRQITYVSSGPTCYQDSHWSRPFYWTAKNALGWLVDGMLCASLRWPGTAQFFRLPLTLISTIDRCPDQVRLDCIDLNDGK